MSMMLRRRWPKPTLPPGSIHAPRPSGPRCRCRSLITSIDARRSGMLAPRTSTIPAIPHISGALAASGPKTLRVQEPAAAPLEPLAKQLRDHAAEPRDDVPWEHAREHLHVLEPGHQTTELRPGIHVPLRITDA